MKWESSERRPILPDTRKPRIGNGKKRPWNRSRCGGNAQAGSMRPFG
nr:MAG TPA: hypothetical protein [Caudoviricetes sp.]